MHRKERAQQKKTASFRFENKKKGQEQNSEKQHAKTPAIHSNIPLRSTLCINKTQKHKAVIHNYLNALCFRVDFFYASLQLRN